ncbi:MAG TPA: hypothetical protein VHE54_18720, partial [Puia sp.]|nr:hypothetical protein [Puia sp.]
MKKSRTSAVCHCFFATFLHGKIKMLVISDLIFACKNVFKNIPCYRLPLPSAAAACHCPAAAAGGISPIAVPHPNTAGNRARAARGMNRRIEAAASTPPDKAPGKLRTKPRTSLFCAGGAFHYFPPNEPIVNNFFDL